MSSSNGQEIIRFGVFELDTRIVELRKRGVKIKLQDQPFRILVLLLESDGELVTRERLRQELWPENTFVDFEHSLNAAVAKLRLALGDSADNPRFVETVTRQGYRFIAPVESRVPKERVPQAASETPDSSPTDDRMMETSVAPVTARGRRLLWLAGSIAGLCVLAFLVWRSDRVRNSGSAAPRAIPLTSYPGMELYPTFSPDGSQVAFSWLKPGEETTDIYVQQVGGTTPVRLTADPAHDWSPSWSPDGKSIAFVRFSPHPGNASLFVMPPLPGTARKVADFSTRFVRGWLFTGTSVSWSPDSKWIVVTDTTAWETPPLALFLVSLETGEKRQLTSPPPGFVLEGAPAFSPDSRSLAFVRSQNLESREIYVLRLSEDLRPVGPATQITSLRRFVGSPVWTRDGRNILFLAGEKMKGEQLWRIRVPGPGARPEQPQLVPAPFEASALLAIRFRPDGMARLAYMRHYFNPNIWAVDLKDVSTLAQAPRSLIDSTLEDYSPQFSPDGNAIVFESFRSGNPEIWRSDRDGSNAVQLTFSKGPYTGWPRWSPDGQWIVFHTGREGNSDVFIIKSDGGMPKRITDNTANDSMASWSRDGRWIYFCSDRSGIRQVWKLRFEPDSKVSSALPVQVTKGGGNLSQESLDGKLLYYSKGPGTGGSLWSVPLGGGEESRVLPFIPYGTFVAASGGVYFLGRSAPGLAGKILFLNTATNTISPVVALEKASFIGLSLSPDGRRLLFSQVDGDESDLMLLDNWRP